MLRPGLDENREVWVLGDDAVHASPNLQLEAFNIALRKANVLPGSTKVSRGRASTSSVRSDSGNLSEDVGTARVLPVWPRVRRVRKRD
jgi:hypothetical protein